MHNSALFKSNEVKNRTVRTESGMWVKEPEGLADVSCSPRTDGLSLVSYQVLKSISYQVVSVE